MIGPSSPAHVRRLTPAVPLLLGSALVATLVATSVAAAPADLADAKHALQRGVNHASVEEILEARARFQALASLDPRSPEPPYWMALADWRAVPLLMRRDDKSSRGEARRHCEAGLAMADQALTLDPRSADALALKVGLLGLSSNFRSAAAMMTLGPHMENEIRRAVAMAPDNPRVHLFDGINTLHKPKFVGGGAKNALPKLTRSLECYARLAPAADSLAWGRDDAYAWAGCAALDLGDAASARADFTRALEINPENLWVRTILIPQADKKAGDGAPKARR